MKTYQCKVYIVVDEVLSLIKTKWVDGMRKDWLLLVVADELTRMTENSQ